VVTSVRSFVAPGALLVAAALVAGCGSVPDDPARDAAPSPDSPAPPTDGPPTLGSKERPAENCDELLTALGPHSGVYWVKHPDGRSPAFQVYCEQEINRGGWAMVENSVRKDDGTTNAFWGFGYGDRLSQKGVAAADDNYYQGSLYLIGRDYMDIIVDLQDKQALAAVMKATGIDPGTMRFTDPELVIGNRDVFANQFASGWSAFDFDGDVFAPKNCATEFGNVAQHYAQCWAYNLGADAEAPVLDGGVGPHVNTDTLVALGLAGDGTVYSQVKRIARFTRW